MQEKLEKGSYYYYLVLSMVPEPWLGNTYFLSDILHARFLQNWKWLQRGFEPTWNVDRESFSFINVLFTYLNIFFLTFPACF